MSKTSQRLSKTLAAAGVASRRACEELIFAGKVSVNGHVTLLPQTQVSLDKDRIEVDGEPIKRVQKKVYYILNKPHGYTCSNKRLGGKKLVIDLFAPLGLRVFTIGRLDRDTTGLILVTNDGHFANQVIHPSANVVKEYLVKVAQEIGHDHLVTLSKGMVIENTWVKPVRVTKVRKGTLKISVKEGKKREVRLLVAHAGLELITLSRIRIGGLNLGSLTSGDFREMTEQEKSMIFS